MLKFIKFSLKLLISLVLLAIIGMVIFVSVVDANRYKPEINQLLTNTTGYPVTLTGDLSWSILPNLQLTTGEFDIHDPENKNEKLASAHQFSFDVELLPLLKGQAKFKQIQIDSLTYRKLRIDSIKTQLSVNKESAELRDIQSKLYGGSLTGDIMVEHQNGTTQFMSDLKGANIALSGLLRDLIGKAIVSGEGDIQLKLASKGASENDLLQHLSGHVNLIVKSGQIDGINLPRIIDKIIALTKDESVDEPVIAANEQENTTLFDELNAEAVIVNGILKHETLHFMTPLFEVKGTGQTNLMNHTIDYRLAVELKNIKEHTKIAAVQAQLGGSFPIRITGTIEKPIATPDLTNLLKSRAKTFLNQQVDTLMNNESMEKTKKEMKSFFDNLLQ